MSISQYSNLVDLHCHSSASGGAKGTPVQIAEFFKGHGYAAFSLTEHDNLYSLDAAVEACKKVGVEFVPGIEISARVGVSDGPDPVDKVMHILGFFFERTPELDTLIKHSVARSTEWVRGGIVRLRQMGMADITEQELDEYIKSKYGPDDVWKRTYSIKPLRDLLVQRGVLSREGPPTIRDFLKELYPQSQLPPLPEAGRVSRVLAEAGAVRILAHPGDSPTWPSGSGRMPSDAEHSRLRWWLDRYVDGLEAYTYKHTPEYRDMVLEISRSRHVPYSGGSDRHSYVDTTRMSDAPHACLESLKEFRAKL